MTTNNQNLEKLTKRPIQYWFEGGIGELITGSVRFRRYLKENPLSMEPNND